ncbi:hypothetical protein [Halomonas sp. BC04]|nr:hypothetical protein [Halomonas sp. BC04]EWG99709.1 hypothetical protein Q427_23530 [Halomonas sp. BC04]
MIRFAMYERFNGDAVLISVMVAIVLLALAIWGYNPSRGLMARKGGGGD